MVSTLVLRRVCRSSIVLALLSASASCSVLLAKMKHKVRPSNESARQLASVWKFSYEDNRLLSRSCAVCNFHCIEGPQVLKISRNLVILIKQWEINTAQNDKKTLKKEKNTFIPESVIFVRPVASQKSGNYRQRMIVKVAYREEPFVH